jgi:hypothetical protein
VLTEVKAYSSWRSAPTLSLSPTGRPETDLIQIRNIDGLDPVKASVSTTQYGPVDGAAYTGSNVPSRNIVLTVHPNPDWDTWSYESLRKLLYSYFMPKRPTRLVFYSDDMDPVEIYGIVEGVSVNMFSKDPELLVSIICPDPYFTALDPTVLTGQTVRPGGATVDVDYNGSIETGITVVVSWVSGAAPTSIGIKIGDPTLPYLTIASSVDATKYFEMSSIRMLKFVENISLANGVSTNLLSKVQIPEGSSWPAIQPGINKFSVITDQGVQDWELTYYERFGGL